MNRFKRYFPLGFALIFSGLASTSVYHYLNDREGVSHAQPAAAAPVVLADHDLPVGTTLTEKDLTVEHWPSALVADNHFQSPRVLIGRTLKSGLSAMEPVSADKLLDKGENLSTLIPAEMRAVTIQVPASDSLARLLERNSRVDVIAMYDPGDAPPITRVVAQAVRVLAVYHRRDKADTAALSRSMEIMLIVTPTEAERLVIAINKGTVQVAVRNVSQLPADEEALSWT